MSERLKELADALTALFVDGHRYGSRPCKTCAALTEVLGQPFGCDLYRRDGHMLQPEEWTAQKPAVNREVFHTLHEQEQRDVDSICYYRNLAIMHGAGPSEMRNDWDRQLAEKGLSTERDESDPELQAADERQEAMDLWERNELLEQALAQIIAIHDHRVEGYKMGFALNAPEVDVEMCAKVARGAL